MRQITPISQDIWWSEADLICIPTNSTLDKNGYLVMGAGLALQAKRRHPHLPRQAGVMIRPLTQFNQFPEYGLIRIRVSHHVEIGLLQTKTDWRSPSDPELILTSLAKLKFAIESNDIKSVAMPLPGAGKGGLSKAVSLALVNQVLADVGDRIVLCDI